MPVSELFELVAWICLEDINTVLHFMAWRAVTQATTADLRYKNEIDDSRQIHLASWMEN